MKRIQWYGVLLLGIVGIVNACWIVGQTPWNNFGVWFPALGGLLLVGVSGVKLSGKGALFSRFSGAGKYVKWTMVAWLLSLLVVEGYLLLPVNNDELEKPNCMLVLGAGLDGDQLSWLLRERMETAVGYLQREPDCKVVVSGGRGPDEAIAEGVAMKNYLREQGIAEARIIVEDRSKSTVENFRFSKEVLPAEERSVVLVTSDFHMRRAMLLAQRAGFTPLALPSKTPQSIVANCYLREYFALVKSIILDR